LMEKAETVSLIDAIQNIALLHPLLELNDTVTKDLSKVGFDSENMVLERWSGAPLYGFVTLDNGFTFLGFFCGGDWETGVFMIMYWDGKKLRGYIPTDGNVWNRKTKESLGNNEDEDLAFFKQYHPDMVDEKLKQDPNIDNCELGYQLSQEYDADDEKLEADIKARIQYKGV